MAKQLTPVAEKKQPWPRCHYCNANPETATLEDAMRTLKQCNNCRVDIMTRDWTGHGVAAIDVLQRRFGYDAVNKLWMGT